MVHGRFSPLRWNFSSRRAHAAFTGVLLASAIACGALAFDIGAIRVARTQLRTSLDAAALSGATELDGTAAGIAAAQARVLEYADYNLVLKRSVVVDPTNIEIGTWDPPTGSFSVWAPGADPSPVNAVRVSHAVPALSAILTQVAFGTGGFQVEAISTALRPAGANMEVRP